MIDAGSYTLLQGAAKVGREVFTIREASPPDGGFLEDGSAAYSSHRLMPALRTDTSGATLRYRVEELVADRRQELLTVQVSRGHGSERVQTPRGESATEFMVAPGTRLLDDDVFAQYYFIARAQVRGQFPTAGESAVVPLILPRRSGPVVAATVTVVGNERVEVGGAPQPAIHLRIAPSGSEVREVWADPEGRVLRIAIPSRGLVAVRDEMPP